MINTPTQEFLSHSFLRHSLATLAYRLGKVLENPPQNFAAFKAGPSSRSAGEILAHIGDLLAWSITLAQGFEKYVEADAGSWSENVQRFYSLLETLDELIASNETLHAPAEKLFQGPIADALTHTGQLALMRRLAGSAIRGENYFLADIQSGKLGATQTKNQNQFE